MADIDCNSEMLGFHGDEVTLRKTQQDEMRNRRDSGRTRLRSGLDQIGKPHPTDIVSQGSYQMRTMVQDDDNEYDIDDGVYFEMADLTDEHGDPLRAKAARERLCSALQWDGRLKLEAEVKRNCVRQEYPAGYHIDMPVYRIVTTPGDDGESDPTYELASGDEWKESDARAVTTWFNGKVGELNSGQQDGSQMRRITKLTKKLARSRKEWKPRTTSGICITKLVVDHIISKDKRDDQALRETWQSIKDSLDISTKIAHPVLENINLAEHGDNEVIFFRDCLSEALGKLKILDKRDCSRGQARAAWDDVFNTSYFSDYPGGGDDDDDDNKKELFSISSGGVTRRDDDGGRFG